MAGRGPTEVVHLPEPPQLRRLQKKLDHWAPAWDGPVLVCIPRSRPVGLPCHSPVLDPSLALRPHAVSVSLRAYQRKGREAKRFPAMIESYVPMG
jgi:hypothetical protein